MKKLYFVVLFLLFVIGNSQSIFSQEENNLIVVGYIGSEINFATFKYIENLINYAEKNNARLIILEINTPGGELTAIKNIVTLFESSKIPICSFVYPRGAVAWSGGVFLLLSSHIAVMASGTTIGSVQPVEITPTGISFVNKSKIINAVIALLKHNSRLHGRNETIAEKFVRENLNLGAKEAKKYNVIDLIADDISTLLEELEEKKLISYTVGREKIWRLVNKNFLKEGSREIYFSNIANAKIIEYREGPQIIILKAIINPMIAILLLVFGLYVFLIGLKTPGFGAEITGGIMILLSLAGLGFIGVEWTGVIIIVIGFILTLLELKTHIGVLVIAGAFLIVFGSLILIPSSNFLVSYRTLYVMRIYIILTGVVMGSLFSLLVYKVAKIQLRKPAVGIEKFIGAIGIATTDIDPIGEIRVLGEYWRAKARKGSIKKGEKIRVVDRDGLTMVVEKVEEV